MKIMEIKKKHLTEIQSNMGQLDEQGLRWVGYTQLSPLRTHNASQPSCLGAVPSKSFEMMSVEMEITLWKLGRISKFQTVSS